MLDNKKVPALVGITNRTNTHQLTKSLPINFENQQELHKDISNSSQDMGISSLKSFLLASF